MGHAAAEIIHNRSIIGHSEFNGTVDVMAWNSWYDTFDEMYSHWREMPPTRRWIDRCSCPGIDAFIYTCYGGGFYWPVRICLEHRVILDGMIPWDDEKETSPVDGHPLGHKHPLEEYLETHVETQHND